MSLGLICKVAKSTGWQFLRIAVLAAFCTAPFSIAQAQELLASPVADKLNESFDTVAASSGVTLAGIAIGAPRGKFTANMVRLPASNDDQQRVCVVGRTADGRYFSENVYIVPTGTQSSALARLEPVTQQFGDQLATYDANAFSVTAGVVQRRCGETVESFIPWVADPQSRSLQVKLRQAAQGRRIRATLLNMPDGEPISEFECGDFGDGSTPAFDTLCTLELSGDLLEKPAPLMIRVETDTGFELVPRNYPIRLPALRDLR